MTLAFAASLLIATGLLALALRTQERRRQAPVLSLPRLPAPGTTVLLPIRNELHNVIDCVETLMAQSACPLVRVIDDGSTDGSGELAADRAADEPRLTVLEAGPLPAGWRGKVHALWAGAQGVATPWLLSTDADTRHAPDLLARAHAAAADHGLDAISLAGVQEVRGLGENLLIPPVFALLDALLGDWGEAAAGRGPAVANGQFILLRREAWEACGGFETVRFVPLDDIAVAARLRAGGFRTGFFRTDGLRVRMYQGWGEAFRGWRRNLAGLLSPNPRTVALALAVLVLPVAAIVAATVTDLAVEATLLWTAGAAASMLLRAGGGHRAAWGFLYPLDALALAGVIALASVDRRRGRMVSWKGREMRV